MHVDPPVNNINDKPGDILIAGYKVEKKLGQGGFGTTFKASKDGKYYVVKQMLREHAIYEYDELQAITSSCRLHLNCPVAIFDGENGISYLITEYIPGKDLTNYTNMSEKFYNELARQMLIALITIHNLNVVHRDIKPANIMYEENTETFYLIDFGLACHKKNTLGSVCNISCAGTPLFMSPFYDTKCENNEPVSYIEYVKNDLFALAITLFVQIEDKYPAKALQSKVSGQRFYKWDEPTPYVRSTDFQKNIIADLVAGQLDAQKIYFKYFLK